MQERDLEEAAAALAAWIERTPGRQAAQVEEVTTPTIGFSGEILLFEASWRSDGERHGQGMAVRIEPSSHQLFPDTNFENQYRVQEVLHPTPVPVARTLGFETDRSLLGSRFFALERMPGRPYDVQADPASWILDLDVDQQERMCHNFLDVLAGIHRLNPRSTGLQFMDSPDIARGAMDQQIEYYRGFLRWSCGDHPEPVIDAGFDWMERNRPDVLPPTGLLWGDARMGNLLWDDEQRCTAVLDWEMCTLGPAEADLAWFLFQDHATPDTVDSGSPLSCSGAVVPPGVPSVEAICDRYARALGRPVVHLEYFMMWAALRTAVIITRLAPLLVRRGIPAPPNVGTSAVAQLLGLDRLDPASSGDGAPLG